MWRLKNTGSRNLKIVTLVLSLLPLAWLVTIAIVWRQSQLRMQITHIEFSADGDLLAVGLYRAFAVRVPEKLPRLTELERSIVFLDGASGRQRRPALQQRADGHVTRLALNSNRRFFSLSRDSTRVAVAALDGSVEIMSLNSLEQPVAHLEAIESCRGSVAYGTRKLAMAGTLGVCVGSLSEGSTKLLSRLQLLRWLAFGPDGTLLGVATDENVRLFDLESQAEQYRWPQQDEPHVSIRSFAFAPTSRTIAIACSDGLRVWSYPEGAVMRIGTRTEDSEDDAILALAYSNDGRLLAAGGPAGIQVWDTQNWTQVDSGVSTVGITALTFAPSRPQLAIATEEGLISVVDVRQGRLLWSRRVDD
jgi:WD40 repeat protein